MLELIFQGLIEWLYGLILEAWEYFSSSLLDIMSMDFAYLEEHIVLLPTIRSALQAIGYKETVGLLRGEKTLEETVEEIKRSTRRYAKRQLTWFRKYRDMRWIMQSDTPDLEEVRRISTQYVREFGI